MRAGGGKQKGASFERAVCVALSKWVSAGKQEDVFWRSAMSGGRATVARKNSGKRLSSQVGDISCISPIGGHFIQHFAPECKHYADLNFQGLITGKGNLLTFWDTIYNEARIHNKLPFLVARQNRMPAVVCLCWRGKTILDVKTSNALLTSPGNNLYIFNFEWFLENCKPFVEVKRKRSKLGESNHDSSKHHRQ